MTIEERLNEIVEKGQGDAIIPFLQGLTQEERKTLVPCLNKLEEHYNKFVQLNENTYGTRGTPEQHRIINLTALVIYSLKEFRKHEWGIYTEQLNELIPWYIPSWIDSFFKEGESREFGGFYGMNYETLMDWIEQGVLTLTPSPQTIAGYLVNYMNNTDFLQKLKAEIPAFLHHLQHRKLSTEKKSRMWFAPSLLHTEALQRIIRSNRNRLEIEMHELILDIMDSIGTDTFSFCYNDILLLLVHSQVKVEKHQVRKVLQECWKLTPASNGLTYTTYQLDYNRECRYEPVKRVGRFYTVTREQLESL